MASTFTLHKSIHRNRSSRQAKMSFSKYEMVLQNAKIVRVNRIEKLEEARLIVNKLPSGIDVMDIRIWEINTTQAM